MTTLGISKLVNMTDNRIEVDYNTKQHTRIQTEQFQYNFHWHRDF